MSYAIFNDWSEENRFEKWENQTTSILRSIIEDKENPRFKEVTERLEVLDDEGNLVNWYEEALESYEPIYNYIYPLETNPSEEDILEVSLKTNCCVMYNNEEDKYYLSLIGCGMDMSQDIALSYVILERWIPTDLIRSISTQKGLTQGGEDFERLRKAIIEQSEHHINNFNQLRTDWGTTPKEE